MKRISIISLGTLGAGPIYTYEMANALANSGKVILQIILSDTISNLNRWIERFSNCKNVELHFIHPYDHNKLSAVKSLFSTKKKQAVVELIQNFKADVLYVPFGLLWANYVYKKLYKTTRIIITIHDPKLHDSIKNLNEYFYAFFSKKSFRYVSDIILLNKKDVKFIEEKYNKPVLVIPHACFTEYNKNTIKDNRLHRRIGFVGRIEPYKGLDILIDAFEQSNTKDLELLIAGSGKIEDNLLERINANKKITLINRYIQDEEFEMLFNQIDFLVLPYKRASQSGVIPLAFSFGKTVIATNVGALEEQVSEGTGVLTEINSSAISKEIDNLYKQPSLIQNFGKEALCYAQSNLTWDCSAQLFIEYIENN